MGSILEILDQIATVIGIIGTGYSISIWTLLKKKEQFNKQRIKILLKMPEETFRFPYEIERKYLTRSELQGLLGILPMETPGNRYQLSFLNTPTFFANLKAAQDNKDVTSIEIICPENEVAQFDLKEIKKQCSVTDI